MQTNPHLLNRQIQQVEEIPNSKLTFSVLQWNTLARCYTSSKHFPLLPREAIDFEVREKLLSQEIKSYNADVICLEEVDKTDLQFFKSLYSENEYSFSYAKKPHSKDGICILIKRPFELMEEEMIEHTNENKEKQNLVSQVVVAKQKKGDLEICLIVASCHLKAANFPQVRLNQAKQIIEVIEKKKQKYMELGYKKENMIVLVCGDFNDCHESESTQEFLQHKDLNLKSAFEDVEYTLFQKYGNREFTIKGVFDYVLHSDNLILTKKIGPPETQISEDGLLSLEFPSDHLSLFCELSLPETGETKKIESGFKMCSIF